MHKFGSYKILKNLRLIVEYHAGDINTIDFISSRKIISRDKDYNPDFDLIFDYRDVNMVVSQEDIDMFVDFLKEFSPILGRRRSAYLTNKPNEVVITMLFADRIKDLSIYPSTFSSLEGVIGWINNRDIDELLLSKVIDEIKSQPNTLYK